jgi:hypothetical protein
VVEAVALTARTQAAAAAVVGEWWCWLASALRPRAQRQSLPTEEPVRQAPQATPEAVVVAAAGPCA